jgi:magnesium-transporting ATPase (P-type)
LTSHADRGRDPAAERPAPGNAAAEPWAHAVDAVLSALATTSEGLARNETERRLAVHGVNELEEERAVRRATILLRQFRSP